MTDYVTVNGSATNIGAFVVWNIRVETLSVSDSAKRRAIMKPFAHYGLQGSYINIRKRYSEFDDFRRHLVQTFLTLRQRCLFFRLRA